MKITVVGSRGFVGSYLTAYLRNGGHDVQAASSSDCSGLDPTTGRLSRDFSIAQGTEAVVYLAQSPYYRRVPEMFCHVMSVSALSAFHLAELSRRAGVSKFVYASTGNVYSPGFSPFSEESPLNRDNWYSLSKIHAEEGLNLFRSYMDITILRLFGVYGPRQTNKLIPNIIESVVDENPLFVEKNPTRISDLGGLRISPCFIDDLVQIAGKIIGSEDIPVLNVASDEVVSIREISTMIADICKKGVNLQCLDRFRATDLVADVSLLTQKCHSSFVTFRDGIERTVHAFLEARQKYLTHDLERKA